MLRATSIAAFAIAACSRGPVTLVASAPEAPVASAPATTGTVPESRVETPAPPPSVPSPDPPAVTIPPELSGAPAWILRVHTSNLIRPRPSDSLETYTLRRHGDRALLTIESRTLDAYDTTKSWSPARTRLYLGSVESKGKAAVALTLASGKDPMALVCSLRRLSVARASAKLAHGGRDFNVLRLGLCPQTACWVPRATRTVEVLRCVDRELLERRDPEIDDWTGFVFAAAPGIEHVQVADDTALQGSGWREVPEDGSIEDLRYRR